MEEDEIGRACGRMRWQNDINTFTAIVDLSRFNNSCLKIASVDLSRSNFSIARAPLFQLKSAT